MSISSVGAVGDNLKLMMATSSSRSLLVWQQFTVRNGNNASCDPYWGPRTGELKSNIKVIRERLKLCQDTPLPYSSGEGSCSKRKLSHLVELLLSRQRPSAEPTLLSPLPWRPSKESPQRQPLGILR